VGKAVESGGLSLDQARVLTELPERLSEQLSRDEVTLVNTVGALSVVDTRRVVDYWKTAVDGPGTEATAELFDRRYLFGSKTWDGMIKSDGLLDPVAGDLVMTALQAATPPRRDGDLRTPRQRRADALTDLARTFLDSGQAAGSEKPHVLVLTDLTCPEAVSWMPPPCPCKASIPLSMRRALIARDRHCRHPGCDRPAQFCDAHHVKHWADGGPTALSNLKLLCRYHHTLQHRSQSPPLLE